MNSYPLIVIAGTTGSGKSDLAVELALTLGGEVISCDSVQIRRGMNIGSGKITREEMRGVSHHMLDLCDVDAEYNVALYQSQALQCINEIRSRHHVPILCGGTGLFLNAVIYPMNLSDAGKPDPEYRKALERFAQEEGEDALFARLQEVDPQSAAVTEKQNVRRVIRALEMVKSGKSKSESASEAYGQRRLREEDMILLALDAEKSLLEERIRRRVDRMMDQGFLREVQSFLDQGYDPDLPMLQTLGYKELIQYLSGEIASLEEAVELIKIHTRQYAKKQRTWLKREKRYRWLDGALLAQPGKKEEFAQQLRAEMESVHE